ncbi:hypothetical protein DFJ67_5447 [Asanoa ferruginea]|uniref:WD40 repeat protein n=1 Tax=Asanoa ferruginea TaxID=53367 RepID=A0A3D9ZQ72_9ACTN|nr:hypothetical protein [Asanoa ferruginea]REF99411.1 hypothetical protein DFJ67_5447 [Asanoa ferruginea]GIF46015.1 hypothetical protein Afe04nite_05540 [Asanoa ferruginea]
MGSDPRSSSWWRRPLVRRLPGLVAALAAGAALLATTPNQARTPKPPPPPVDAVWPNARRADLPGALKDGVPYNPDYFVDDHVSAGTALDKAGRAVRLVLRAADGTVRILRQLPVGTAPQFAGFTSVSGQLVWAESVTGADKSVRTSLWRADLAGGAPRKITDDTGWAVFPGSDHDIVADSGRLYWIARASGGDPATEVRSVPVDGGPVLVRTEPGEWALSGWPWLVSPSHDGRAQLRRIDTGDTVDVDAGGDELDQCGPAWCRVYVLSGDAPARTELIRPDGSDRKRVADDGATAAIVEVAPLDRFEILAADSTTIGAAIGGQRLLVYDLRAGRTVLVTEAAASVSYRAGVLWWSTNALGRITWHTLDLRSV